MYVRFRKEMKFNSRYIYDWSPDFDGSTPNYQDTALAFCLFILIPLLSLIKLWLLSFKAIRMKEKSGCVFSCDLQIIQSHGPECPPSKAMDWIIYFFFISFFFPFRSDFFVHFTLFFIATHDVSDVRINGLPSLNPRKSLSESGDYVRYLIDYNV